MIFIILIIFAAFFALGYKLDDIGSEFGAPIVGGSVVGIFATSIMLIVLIIVVSSGMKIEEEIAIHKEENDIIEHRIEEVVSNYLGYESKMCADLKNDDYAVSIIAAHPALSSSELVKSQIEIYNENTIKIKELRLSKIRLSLCKWWLYFGD